MADNPQQFHKTRIKCTINPFIIIITILITIRQQLTLIKFRRYSKTVDYKNPKNELNFPWPGTKIPSPLPNRLK